MGPLTKMRGDYLSYNIKLFMTGSPDKEYLDPRPKEEYRV